MSGYAFAFGRCYACGRRFTFDPDLVPSVPIDRETRLPPDVGGTDPAAAIREPLCADCVERVNAERAAAGRDLIWTAPGAYP